MVRLAAHMRRALHVVLTAQRIDASAGLADVTAEQCQIDQRHHAICALGVFGHAEAVKTDRRLVSGVEPRRFADQLRIDTAERRRALRRPITYERAKLGEFANPLAHELAVVELLFDDDLSEGVD